MDATTLLLFVPACFAINMAPGPNNLLSISNATRYGFRAAWMAGAGRLIAFAGMIALASAGLAVVLHTSELLFMAIKTAGAFYLFYIAWQLWRAGPGTEGAAQAGATMSQLLRQEFLVAAGNPKAILVFTAFLPQFVDPSQPMALQFTILGGLFLLFEIAAIAVYAWMGVGMRRFLGDPRGRQLFNRSCATLLGGAGLGLLLSRRA
ncbi:LysE family translocator [Massilia endophytica]|uniref:LysE family translocator n=1 Tax=Massilia endophytica TaxID=2899220 RepID=UPI001E5F82A1|nr:LysE family translocator [Massilia endophytica]UGQ47480.1 LysE family translocator [Massilia endophytica]